MKLAVLSGKGGTGKTLVSVNLAAVAEQAAYYDCDVEEPNGHLFFKPEQVTEKTEEKEERTNRKYVVEGGDSLGYISRKFYGDNSGIHVIMDTNGLKDADMIYEGQVLWIPAE